MALHEDVQEEMRRQLALSLQRERKAQDWGERLAALILIIVTMAAAVGIYRESEMARQKAYDACVANGYEHAECWEAVSGE